MRDSAIREVIYLLENQHHIDMSKFVALDLFARDATWQTKFYAHKVSKVHAWEIEKRFKNDLEKNLPSNAVVSIGDSHKMIQEEGGNYDLVVLDNPQGCYGSKYQYCEHFDSLLPSLGCVSDNSIIIFNVKTKPFDFEDKIQWARRREKFYKVDDSSDISLDFMNQFYEKLFTLEGFQVGIKLNVRRPQEDGLYMFAYQLIKKEER